MWQTILLFNLVFQLLNNQMYEKHSLPIGSDFNHRLATGRIRLQSERTDSYSARARNHFLIVGPNKKRCRQLSKSIQANRTGT